MTKLITENATIFQIGDDLKPPKTDKEFLAHGLMQMIVELAPKAMLEYAASEYRTWATASNWKLLAETVQTHGENVQKLARPNYPKVLGISPEVYNYIDGKVDALIGYDDCGGITAMLDNMLIDGLFTHASLLMSMSLNGEDYGYGEFHLDNGCTGGQVYYLVTNALVNMTDLSEIRPDGLLDEDVDTVMVSLVMLDNYSELKPGDIEHLVENHAIEWLTKADKHEEITAFDDIE